MTLSNQVKSNRANAQKSTGPKTDYGKSIACQNALKHGILSQRIIVGNESQALFQTFANDILEDFAPRNQTERELVERIIYAMWKQRRLRHAETASAELSMQPEIILREINISASNDHRDRFTLNDFSTTTIARYEGLQQVLEILVKIDYQAYSKNITALEQTYPLLKSYLENYAKRLGSDYNVIKNSPVRMVDLMERLESQLNEILALENKGYRALQLKALMEEASRIPRDASNQYLARYQVQLDNEIYKAMEMLKKHREWAMQTIEVETEVEIEIAAGAANTESGGELAA